MKIKNIQSHDGLNLTYYEEGAGDEVIVILNAPGMSVKFWLSIIELLKTDYRIIAFEYRGYPESNRVLDMSEIAFDNFIQDIETIISAEGEPNVHLISWCLGSKLAFEFYRKSANKVRSMTFMGISYTEKGAVEEGHFSSSIYEIKKKVDSDPDAAPSMVSLMKMIGTVPPANFYEQILTEEKGAATLNLLDILERESSMSNLAFYLLEDPIGFRNYLNIFDVFRRVRVMDVFDKISVSTAIVTGGQDRIGVVTPEMRKDLELIPDIEFHEVKKGSHFMLLEYPEKISLIIKGFHSKCDEVQEESVV